MAPIVVECDIRQVKMHLQVISPIPEYRHLSCLQDAEKTETARRPHQLSILRVRWCFSSGNDRVVDRGQKATPPDSPEQVVPIRPAVVGYLPRGLEWGVGTWEYMPGSSCGHADLGCYLGLGCGAFTATGAWFQLQWPDSWASVHITVKGLEPVVLACAVWGPHWWGRTVECRCDNAAVVAIICSRMSKHPLVMYLMRCLFFIVAYYQLYLLPVHLPGKYSEAVDTIS